MLVKGATGRIGSDFKRVSMRLILQIHILSPSRDYFQMNATENPIGYKSTLVQVMAWPRQGKNRYLNNVDPDICRHMAPLGYNDLKPIMQMFDSGKHSSCYLVSCHRDREQLSDESGAELLSTFFEADVKHLSIYSDS